MTKVRDYNSRDTESRLHIDVTDTFQAHRVSEVEEMCFDVIVHVFLLEGFHTRRKSLVKLRHRELERFRSCPEKES